MFYNVRTTPITNPATFRVTKFDADLNPVASYLTSAEGCECPAGVRSTCRHRDMVPVFAAKGRIDTAWVCQWDRGSHDWREFVGPLSEAASDITATEIDERMKEAAKTYPTPDFSPVLDRIAEIAANEAEPITGTKELDASTFSGFGEAGPVPEAAWNSLPKGVTMITLDSPDKIVDVHNAVAEAVGEAGSITGRTINSTPNMEEVEPKAPSPIIDTARLRRILR